MLWYQCRISMNFYLPTKLQRNRRFHTTSVAVRGYRRPRVCHGWRKLCYWYWITVSPQKKNVFICQAWFQKYPSLFWKNTRSFDSGWILHIFAINSDMIGYIVGAVSSHLIHISTLASSSIGLSWKTFSFNHLASSRFRNKMWEIAQATTQNLSFSGVVYQAWGGVCTCWSKIYLLIFMHDDIAYQHGRCSNKIDVLLLSHSVL